MKQFQNELTVLYMDGATGLLTCVCPHIYSVFHTHLQTEESSLLNVGQPAHVPTTPLKGRPLYVQFNLFFSLFPQQKLIDFSSQTHVL